MGQFKNSSLWINIAVTVTLYSILCLLSMALTVSGKGMENFTIGVASIALASIHLSAAWAVLGPGTYWKRASISFLLLSVIGAGAVAPLIYVQTSTGGSELIGVIISLFSLPFVWICSQFAFWPFYFLGGWRIETHRQDECTPLSIMDLVLISSGIAVALAGLQWVPYLVKKFDPVLTPSDIGVNGLYIYGVLAAFAAIMFVVPALFTMLNLTAGSDQKVRKSSELPAEIGAPEVRAGDEKVRAEHKSNDDAYVGGCLIYGLFVLAMAVLIAMVVGVFTNDFTLFVIIPCAIIFLMTPYLFFLCVPLIVVREGGVRLTSFKQRIRKKLTE